MEDKHKYNGKGERRETLVKGIEQSGNAESKRDSLPQGRIQQLVI